MEIQEEAFPIPSMSVSWACLATTMARPASAAGGAAWGTVQGPDHSVPQPGSQPRSQKQFCRAQAGGTAGYPAAPWPQQAARTVEVTTEPHRLHLSFGLPSGTPTWQGGCCLGDALPFGWDRSRGSCWSRWGSTWGAGHAEIGANCPISLSSV